MYLSISLIHLLYHYSVSKQFLGVEPIKKNENISSDYKNKTKLKRRKIEDSFLHWWNIYIYIYIYTDIHADTSEGIRRNKSIHHAQTHRQMLFEDVCMSDTL